MPFDAVLLNAIYLIIRWRNLDELLKAIATKDLDSTKKGAILTKLRIEKK